MMTMRKIGTTLIFRRQLIQLFRIYFNGGNLLGQLPANPAATGGFAAGLMPRTRRDDEREPPGGGRLLAHRLRDFGLRRRSNRHQQSQEKERSSVRTPPRV